MSQQKTCISSLFVVQALVLDWYYKTTPLIIINNHDYYQELQQIT